MNRGISEPSATVATTVGLLHWPAQWNRSFFADADPTPDAARHGLTFAQGGWLATGNYLGYLVGALICMAFAPRPVRAIRWGLICVAVLTVAMGLSRSPLLWFAFRFSAGMASAFVLVGVSAWAMPILARCDKAQWSGFVFAGVGIGVVFAGLVGLAAGLDAWGSRLTWIVMGVVAAVLAFFLWGPLATNAVPADAVASRMSGVPRRVFVAAACYGLFGYGYIIPATFLPRWLANISTIQRCSAGCGRCSARPPRFPHLAPHG